MVLNKQHYLTCSWPYLKIQYIKIGLIQWCLRAILYKTCMYCFPFSHFFTHYLNIVAYKSVCRKHLLLEPRNWKKVGSKSFEFASAPMPRGSPEKRSFLSFIWLDIWTFGCYSDTYIHGVGNLIKISLKKRLQVHNHHSHPFNYYWSATFDEFENTSYCYYFKEIQNVCGKTGLEFIRMFNI